ncbi:IMP cyclohydrolase [Candidatus Bathyarchaeota archaeon]|nr:IMP cyclohydrolase [Candidatus Bathyarchaeota archaeon]
MSIKKLYRTKLSENFPDTIKITIGDIELEYVKAQSLRYGENPHQPAAFYAPKDGENLTVGAMNIIKSGKGGLSRTNIEDMNNAINIVRYFDDPTCAVMKHVNPSGVATSREGDKLVTVYQRARDSDPVAAFGSVVGYNCSVDKETAEEMLAGYVEAVIAPSYDSEALEVLEEKKDLRVIQVDNIKKISRFVDEAQWPLVISTMNDGSFVLSTPMLTKIRGINDFRWVTERKGSEDEALNLLFAWYVNLNVRSNGVVLSEDKQTLGIGTGQQDRVIAVKQALQKAEERGHKERLSKAVLASDGFFPFPDSIEVLASYGVKACCQPGGSIKDKEVIEACNKFGIAMAFTDERCFRHF